MSVRSSKPRVRAPDATRQNILAAAFEEVYRHGFQAASLDTIVERAGVTKGALYHHFADKSALGRAVVDEVIRPPVLEAYLGRLTDAGADPLTALIQVVRRRADDFETLGVDLGCPLNNLAQEMSPLDETLRRRISAALEAWTEGFVQALAKGQAQGHVRPELNARQVAGFMVAAIEGAFGMAKNARSPALLRANLNQLADFLETLRPQPARRPPRRRSTRLHGGWHGGK